MRWPGPAARAWVAAALYSGLLLVAVPYVRAIQVWVKDTVGSQVFTIGTLVSLVLAAVAATALAARHSGRLRWQPVAWAALLLAVAAGWSLRVWEPEEAVHLVEYGLLGVLLYRALRHHFDDAAVLLAAVVLGALIGIVDELVQFVTPRRYFDYRDVRLNLGASVLTQAGLWLVAEVGEARRWPSRASLRVVVRLLALLVAVLAGCLATTPQRCFQWAQRVPALAPLVDPEDAVTEYGHRHELPGIGVFRSRFSLDELARVDRERAAEAAAILDAYNPHERYREFLDTYPPGRDPFVHEARVHVFSRNSNVADGRRTSGEEARAHFTVAFREQLILERCFPATFSRSKAFLGPNRRRELEAAADPSAPFESRVGAHLVTAVSEAVALSVAAILLLALVACDIALGRGPVRPTGSR